MKYPRFRHIGWSQLLPLDVFFSMCIIAVVSAMFAAQIDLMILKARLADVPLFFAFSRIRSAEDYAVTGELVAPASTRAGAQALMPAGQSGQRIAFTIDGSSVIASGPLPGRSGHATGRDLEIAFNPAVIPGELPWSVLWTCGARAAPSGWSMPAVPRATSLSPEETPAVCRVSQKDAK